MAGHRLLEPYVIILRAPTIVFVIMIVKDSELIKSPGIESAEVENGTIIRAWRIRNEWQSRPKYH